MFCYSFSHSQTTDDQTSIFYIFLNFFLRSLRSFRLIVLLDRDNVGKFILLLVRGTKQGEASTK